MNLDLVSSLISLLTLVPLALIFVVGAFVLPLGSVSLPCMTVITSFIYFYLMPVVSLANGDNGFLGMYITGLEWTHFAVFLYVMGAAAAFLAQRRALTANPAVPRLQESSLNMTALIALWAVAAMGIIFEVLAGRLNLAGGEAYESASDSVVQFKFINQSYNMMVPLTLIVLLRDKFRARSLLFLVFVIIVFVQAGFRYRIMILLAALATSYAVDRGFKMRIAYAFGGTIIALFLVNLIGAVRRYGQGIDLSRLNQDSFDNMTNSFGGEFGIVYVLSYIADHPLPEMATFEPWIVGIARLVPSVVWPDKPTADYVNHFIAGATVANADQAGVAAPQQVEMLLQFGWLGVPILSFIYFSIAGYLIYRLGKLGREARIAGCAIVPAFFGFYMQTRGYFFQVFSDGLFMFAPLFFVHAWNSRQAVLVSRARTGGHLR